MNDKILIVDDDLKLQKLLKKYLQGYGYKIISQFEAKGTISTVQSEQPDIIILDIVLPDGDGLEILTDIRRISALPVIMLSAKGEDLDRIVGIEMGADDYLPKPFNPRELMARIKAVSRRMNSRVFSIDPDKKENKLCVGAYTLDTNRHTLINSGEAIVLTITEYKILEVLMAKPNMVFSRAELLSYARENDYSMFDRTIDMHISRIRTKIESVFRTPDPIQTARGIGYMFVDAIRT